MEPTCFNVNRRSFKCRSHCCKKVKEVVPEPLPYWNKDRFRSCVICKRKYYASGVQCLLSNPDSGDFNCMPNR